MKKEICFLLSLVILSSCKKEEQLDPICNLIDWTPAFFRIKIRDSADNDLIKNGSYDKETVSVIYDGRVIGRAGQGKGNLQNEIRFHAAEP